MEEFGHSDDIPKKNAYLEILLRLVFLTNDDPDNREIFLKPSETVPVEIVTPGAIKKEGR